MTDTPASPETTEGLEPCPFCLGIPRSEDRRMWPDWRCWAVHCTCRAGPTTTGKTEAEAIAAWNRRPAPASPPGEPGVRT